jgi:hypothetical protein
MLVMLCGRAALAEAVDVGQCNPPERMTEVLRAEGQRSLVYGNQQIRAEQLPSGELRGVNKLIGLIFTSDAAGKVGYVLQADQPIGTRAEKICVSDRMQNVKLYDAIKTDLPREVFVSTTEAQAGRRCDELAREGTVASGSWRIPQQGSSEPRQYRRARDNAGERRQQTGEWLMAT